MEKQQHARSKCCSGSIYFTSGCLMCSKCNKEAEYYFIEIEFRRNRDAHNPDFNLLGSEPGKKLRFKPLIKPTKRDWIEDFDHENGYYQNNCRDCKLNFFGFKQRMWCKACIKPKKVKQKKPTGILKDLMEVERYYVSRAKNNESVLVGHRKGAYVEWSDIETIIKKYANP